MFVGMPFASWPRSRGLGFRTSAPVGRPSSRATPSPRPPPPGEEPWPSYFSMPVLLLMLITLLNDGTLISIGYDNVQPSHMPEKWNLRVRPCACGSAWWNVSVAVS